MRVRYDRNAKQTLDQSNIYIGNPKEVKGTWRDLFDNDNPIHLEIGMGKGTFIINMAIQFPDINFIGMERNETILALAYKKIEKEEIKNIRIISDDAIGLLDIFEKEEIDKIYLNFSDPWPKNKHYKRRLTYRAFLDLYDVVLKKNSVIEFKTDNKLLFDFTVLELEKTQRTVEKMFLDLHSTNEFNIMTEYEEKFSKKGNNIYKIIWHKKCGE